ncbi:MAG: serine/threonine protein kinase [Polyangiaceae bacterium]|nr:serine/threonine protein kinase [Polyangiaceae bacterium]
MPRDGAALPTTEIEDGRYAEGQVLAGKYRLNCVIGQGGMGAVWLARHVALEQHVAVKVVRHEAAGAEASARLHREALAAARVRHAAIVQVFDFGTTEHDDPFIVMELVQGETLAELLGRRGKLEQARAVQLLLPIVDALSFAHAEGIVHRDVKPENIALVSGAHGTVQPKLVDFGIAKLAAPEATHAPQPRGPALPSGGLAQTRLGAVVGSPSYLSPEQALGSPVAEPRTDVWQLCVVLYELVAGRLPFHSEDLEVLLLDVLTRDPSPIAGCDENLWRIIRRGLEKRPDDRWPDMRALGRALAEWLAAQGATTDAAGTRLSMHWLGARPTLAPPGASEPAPAPPARRDPAQRASRGLGRHGWVALLVAAGSFAAAAAVWAIAGAAAAPQGPPASQGAVAKATGEPAPAAPEVAARANVLGPASAPPVSLGVASSVAPPPVASAPSISGASSIAASTRPPWSRAHGAAPADPGF